MLVKATTMLFPAVIVRVNEFSKSEIYWGGTFLQVAIY